MIHVTDHCKLRWMSRINHQDEEQEIKNTFRESMPIGWENTHRARYHPPTNALTIWKPDGEDKILVTVLILNREQVREDERTGIDHLAECVEADPFDQLFEFEKGCGRLVNPAQHEACPWCGNNEFQGLRSDEHEESLADTYKKVARQKQGQ